MLHLKPSPVDSRRARYGMRVEVIVLLWSCEGNAYFSHVVVDVGCSSNNAGLSPNRVRSYLSLSPRLTYDENNDITGTALNNLMPYEGAIFLAFPHFTFQHLATCVFQYSSLSLCLSECNDVCVIG